MAASAGSCAHCRKQGVGLQRCSVCKDAFYCGAACQKAGWKRHKKKTCAPPLSFNDVFAKVRVAHTASDWEEVLKWEGRMEELMVTQDDGTCETVLMNFQAAHEVLIVSTLWSGSSDHNIAISRLQERRIELLGKLQRFRDQGDLICDLADSLLGADKHEEAERYFQQARSLGAAHGFFSVESSACLGLGKLAIKQGRGEEGLDLMRNAHVAGRLTENDGSSEEGQALLALIDALFETDAIDEVEPLVERYREVATAWSRRKGVLSTAEIQSCYFSAQLHEVGNPVAPLIPPRPKASVAWFTTLERKNMQSLNLPLSPGTREA